MTLDSKARLAFLQVLHGVQTHSSSQKAVLPPPPPPPPPEGSSGSEEGQATKETDRFQT